MRIKTFVSKYKRLKVKREEQIAVKTANIFSISNSGKRVSASKVSTVLHSCHFQSACCCSAVSFCLVNNQMMSRYFIDFYCC